MNNEINLSVFSDGTPGGTVVHDQHGNTVEGCIGFQYEIQSPFTTPTVVLKFVGVPVTVIPCEEVSEVKGMTGPVEYQQESGAIFADEERPLRIEEYLHDYEMRLQEIKVTPTPEESEELG